MGRTRDLFFKKGLLLGAFSFTIILVTAYESSGARQPSSSSHASYVFVATFKKGAADVSQGDQDALKALMMSIKDHQQKVEQAHVAVWSDKPLAGTVQDRALAEKRIAALEAQLEGPLAVNNVESYNMASRGHWFARAWAAPPKDVAQLFNQAGAPRNVTSDDFASVKAKGSPSHAVILIELEPSSVAPRE